MPRLLFGRASTLSKSQESFDGFPFGKGVPLSLVFALLSNIMIFFKGSTPHTSLGTVDGRGTAGPGSSQCVNDSRKLESVKSLL